MFKSIEDVETKFGEQGYIADRTLATTIYLAVALGKPIFLEGEPGVGKTEVAKVMANILGTELIRLQCYEGLDANTALYEWNYPRQMLELRLEEARGESKEDIGSNIFSSDFLLDRPLLKAIQYQGEAPPVLLIDEVDRSDEEFEAFLLEVLSDFQITIPEIGTIEAAEPPIVIVTSNRTREIHDALKRRCLYHWLDYPDAARELRILQTKVPGADARLSAQVVGFVQELRRQDLFKQPGIAETIDWTSAISYLDKLTLDPETVDNTLGVLLKYQDDIQKIQGSEAARILQQVNAELTSRD